MINITQSHKLNYIVWEEVFSEDFRGSLNSDAIVQVWKGWSGYNPHQTMDRIIRAGYKAIVSQPWYFDWIARGPKWMEDYSFNPRLQVTEQDEDKILGGEACIWTEFVDASNLFPFVYPRLSAVAERLWSNYHKTRLPDPALPRLHAFNCKMRERGLPVAPALYNTNDGSPWLGYCRQPFDPFQQDFFF